jgi:hypothetical protein
MRIKNWKSFQHFKDRRPPWIKLHREMLDQRDINTISDRSFRVLVNLWLLASEDKEMEGNLPELADISFRLRMPEPDINKALQELTPWIESGDITPISERYQDGPLEVETEAYKEETETETQSPCDDDGQFYKMRELTAKAVKFLGWNGNLHQGQTEALRPLTNIFKDDVDRGFTAAAQNNVKSVAYVIKVAGNKEQHGAVNTTEFERLLEESR